MTFYNTYFEEELTDAIIMNIENLHQEIREQILKERTRN